MQNKKKTSHIRIKMQNKVFELCETHIKIKYTNFGLFVKVLKSVLGFLFRTENILTLLQFQLRDAALFQEFYKSHNHKKEDFF